MNRTSEPLTGARTLSPEGVTTATSVASPSTRKVKEVPVASSPATSAEPRPLVIQLAALSSITGKATRRGRSLRSGSKARYSTRPPWRSPASTSGPWSPSTIARRVPSSVTLRPLAT